MKILVVVLVSTVLNPIYGNELTRRQYSGYTTNVIHENPNYPDQTAQSTVKVNFNPNQVNQNYPSQQSQLFNVGYSVRFNHKPDPPPKPKNLDDGEIITGTRKQNEEVQTPHEYVSGAVLANKKQKISGIKPKPQYVANYPNPKTLFSQANLAPSTQQYYKALEHVKTPVQNSQDLQQKYSWTNLGPGVDIIRSTEVPSRQAPHFDHAKALGRSQDFDYSNGIDGQQQLYYTPQHVRAPVYNQNVPKLPLDTTLLQEPVRIQVDTSYVEQAMRNLYDDTKYSQPIAQQPYRTIPVQETNENKPLQIVYQQQPGFQDPTRYQVKIYGKPQPVAAFAEQEKDHSPRQPRFVSDLNTYLRPPPLGAVAYQRRIHLG